MHTGLAPVLILWYCWGFRHNLVEKTVNECSFISVMWSWNAFVQPLIKRWNISSVMSLCSGFFVLFSLLWVNKLPLHRFRSLVTQLCYLTAGNNSYASDPDLFCVPPCICLFEKGSIVCNLLCTYAGFFFFFLVFTQSEAISSLLFCMVLMPISLYNLLISPERRNSSLFCFAPPFFFVSLEGLIEKWKKYQCAHRLC